MTDLLKVEVLGNSIKFTNDSIYDVMISVLPIKPKRKIRDLHIIPYKTYLVLDLEGYMSLSNVCLSFRKRCV